MDTRTPRHYWSATRSHLIRTLFSIAINSVSEGCMAHYHDGDNVGWVHLPPSLHSSDHGTLVGGEAPVHVSQATIMPESSKARAVMNAESEEGRMDLTLRPGDAIIPGRIPDHRVQQPLSWLLAYDYYAATAIHWGPSRTAEKRASRLCCSLGVRVKPGSLHSAGSISWFEPSESGFRGDSNAAEYNRASRSATVRVECQRRVDSISRSNSWETLSGRTPTAATGSVIISRVAYAYGRPV
ncbi:hypothetical protein EDD15DRAFT_2313978 [Pisolithus albus]|nr:hypothetical protein EDD15DRAFT_2313978 [Pisolithus albus]